jgi:membrane protein
MIIFGWLLVRLPRVELHRSIAIRGALLASIGFEILKIVGTVTIAHTAQSPTAGPLGGTIAVLIWIQLVSRYMLFCCAWMAIGSAEQRLAGTAAANTVPVTEPPAMANGHAGADAPPVSPAAVGATLIGAGAIAGAVATWAVTRSHRDD